MVYFIVGSAGCSKETPILWKVCNNLADAVAYVQSLGGVFHEPAKGEGFDVKDDDTKTIPTYTIPEELCGALPAEATTCCAEPLYFIIRSDDGDLMEAVREMKELVDA